MLHNSNVKNNETNSWEILLIEDNSGDVRLIENAMKELENRFNLNIVTDGIQAMDYLYKKNPYTKAITPDLILLDLNIPKKHGHVVLAEIKNDPNLKRIPVIILTISSAEDDILQCYNLHANCYINKPFEIDKLIRIFKSIQNFWLNTVTLPPKKK